MKSRYIILLLMILVLLLGGVAIWQFLDNCQSDACLFLNWQKVKAADSFERCTALGFPVAESFPRQCHADGKVFTETIRPVGNDKIKVSLPLSNALVKNPLRVMGEARGNWYFEASFPIKLLDANGRQLAIAPAQALGEWMTTDFVPFDMLLVFEDPQTDTGILILEKDNPSGLPEFDDSISVPVRFR